VDQLAYFAINIFWRGSVHQWPGGRGDVHTPSESTKSRSAIASWEDRFLTTWRSS
jgi:hypothetical protein